MHEAYYANNFVGSKKEKKQSTNKKTTHYEKPFTNSFVYLSGAGKPAGAGELLQF
jgi:hypothetical protein